MYSENPAKDTWRFFKAVLTNQLARFAPSLFLKLTHETGRGAKDCGAAETADYFRRCFDECLDRIGLAKEESREYLTGKTVLEYGPGDILGVALLMYAHGAESVHCVDRFPLLHLSDKARSVYQVLLESLNDEVRQRAESAFRENGKPESGFHPRAILYSVTPDGLSGKKQEYDLVVSRAVLEHVNNLPETLRDVGAALKKGGVSIHEVDLRSHGLDRYQAFDFLTWPCAVYQWMYSQKGYPNRWRMDAYRKWVHDAGLRFRDLVPTGRLKEEQIEMIFPKLAKPFRQVPREELSWLGFWMALEHA